ncbi:hypothetical protein D3C76_574210 [compost metagenome]
MATQVELGQPVLSELGRAILIRRLGDMVKLVLYQGAELSIGALSAVVGSQSDEVGRLLAEPLAHLLLLTGLLPPASSEHQLLGLTEDHPSLFCEPGRCPEHPDVGVEQVGMLRIMNAAGFGENLARDPLPYLRRWPKRKP